MNDVARPGTPGKVTFDWDSPDDTLLEDRKGGALPPFPIDVFSPGVAELSVRASRGAGVMVDAVAVPLLGTASSLIGKARRVQASTSWLEPCTCWCCVVGDSGDRKSPGLRVIQRTLDAIEKENAPTYHSASLNHLTRVEKAKAAMKQWKKQCADAIAAKREPPLMPIEAIDPGDFIFPTDCTVPRLARLCMIRPRGMLQIRDELSALFNNMRSAGSRPFYLEAWNGERFVVERVADDRCFTVENLLVGLTGGFQPDRLSRAFTGDQDGMSGRFLYAWPATPDYYPLTDDAAEVDPVLQGLLTKLIRLPSEDEKEVFAPRTIPLSKEARAEFEHYRRFVDREKRSVEGLAKQWLAKSETHLLRLAGTLAYLAWADASSGTGMESITAALEPNEIDVRFVADAGRLIQEYFWPHAQAALRQIGLTDRHRHARRALNWCLQNDRDVVSLKDLRRDALNHALDVGETRAQVVDRLVTAGWLRAEPIVTTGGRPKERWEVNPRLFGRAESAQSAERQAQKGAEEQGVIDLSALSALPARAQKPKKGRPQ